MPVVMLDRHSVAALPDAVAGYNRAELLDELAAYAEPGAVDVFNENEQGTDGLKCISMDEVGSYGIELCWVNDDGDEAYVTVDHGDVDDMMERRAAHALMGLQFESLMNMKLTPEVGSRLVEPEDASGSVYCVNHLRIHTAGWCDSSPQIQLHAGDDAALKAQADSMGLYNYSDVTLSVQTVDRLKKLDGFSPSVAASFRSARGYQQMVDAISSAKHDRASLADDGTWDLMMSVEARASQPNLL